MIDTNCYSYFNPVPVSLEEIAFVDDKFVRETVKKALVTIPKRYADVISFRFGLNDGVEHTLLETGKQFGVGKERARAIEAHALRLLRHPSRAKALRALLELVAWRQNHPNR